MAVVPEKPQPSLGAQLAARSKEQLEAAKAVAATLAAAPGETVNALVHYADEVKMAADAAREAAEATQAAQAAQARATAARKGAARSVLDARSTARTNTRAATDAARAASAVLEAALAEVGRVKASG